METSSVGPPALRPRPHPVGSSKMGKDEFMKLLLAQLGNQTDRAGGQPGLRRAAGAVLHRRAAPGGEPSLDSLIMAQAASNQTSMVGLVARTCCSRATPSPGKDDKPQISGELSKLLTS